MQVIQSTSQKGVIGMKKYSKPQVVGSGNVHPC